jgi:hypothetical protein
LRKAREEVTRGILATGMPTRVRRECGKHARQEHAREPKGARLRQARQGLADGLPKGVRAAREKLAIGVREACTQHA